MSIRRTVVVASLFGLALAARASADPIIFNNLGPGDAYSTTTGWFFGYSAPSDEVAASSLFWRAMPFQAQATAALQTVTMPLAWEQLDSSTNAGAVQVVLYGSQNELPALSSVLETFAFSGLHRVHC